MKDFEALKKLDDRSIRTRKGQRELVDAVLFLIEKVEKLEADVKGMDKKVTLATVKPVRKPSSRKGSK